MWGLRLESDPKLDIDRKNENNIPSKLDPHCGSLAGIADNKEGTDDQRALSTLIRNIPGMIYRCYDDDWRTLEYVSEGCLGLTGYKPSDLIDHRVAYNDMIHREDRELIASGIREAIRNDRSFNLIYRILDANGKEKWVWDQGKCSSLKNGGLIVRDGLITDITARLESERKLREAWEQANMYVDLMGHDINNMNQVALGFLELALEKVKQKGRLELADKILLEKPFEALKTNSRLVDNVRKIRRERSGTIKPALVDLGKTLEEVQRQFTDISSRDIAINYRPAERCYVRANELLLDVFLNLAGNAIKHSSGPLRINLKLESELRQEGKYYRVSVEDNGPGISDDQKKKLLDQACLKRARRNGKGFGLCLARTLLEDFNGSIWIEDTVPFDHTKGCRFVVLLPAAEE